MLKQKESLVEMHAEKSLYGVDWSNYFTVISSYSSEDDR